MGDTRDRRSLRRMRVLKLVRSRAHLREEEFFEGLFDGVQASERSVRRGDSISHGVDELLSWFGRPDHDSAPLFFGRDSSCPKCSRNFDRAIGDLDDHTTSA